MPHRIHIAEFFPEETEKGYTVAHQTMSQDIASASEIPGINIAREGNVIQIENLPITMLGTLDDALRVDGKRVFTETPEEVMTHAEAALRNAIKEIQEQS